MSSQILKSGLQYSDANYWRIIGIFKPRSIDIKDGYAMPYPISDRPCPHPTASGAKLIL